MNDETRHTVPINYLVARPYRTKNGSLLSSLGFQLSLSRSGRNLAVSPIRDQVISRDAVETRTNDGVDHGQPKGKRGKRAVSNCSLARVAAATVCYDRDVVAAEDGTIGH